VQWRKSKGVVSSPGPILTQVNRRLGGYKGHPEHEERQVGEKLPQHDEHKTDGDVYLGAKSFDAGLRTRLRESTSRFFGEDTHPTGRYYTPIDLSLPELLSDGLSLFRCDLTIRRGQFCSVTNGDEFSHPNIFFCP
jgi:hypothetical protein